MLRMSFYFEEMLILTVTPMEIVASVVFAVAVLHTFLTKYFERLAHAFPRHSGIFHLLGEVEVVFGLWALVLMLAMVMLMGRDATLNYLESRQFTEPLFVFVIMVVAASRPIMDLVQTGVVRIGAWLPLTRRAALLFVTVCLVPLLGSLITEPAARSEEHTSELQSH